MNRVYYYKTLRATLTVLLAAPAMTALSVLVTVISDNTAIRTIGYIGIAFFGLCFIYGAFNCLRGTFRREALALTPASLTVNTPSGNSYTLAWSDIADIASVEVAGERTLAIMLHDPQAFIGRYGRTAAGRGLMRIDGACTGSPCSVATYLIDGDESEITETLKRYAARYGNPARSGHGPAQD